MRAFVLLLVLMSACRVSPERIDAAFARAKCTRSDTCDHDALLDTYGSVDACIDTVRRDIATTLNCQIAHCTYDGEQAAECVRRFRSAKCSEFTLKNFSVESCKLVFRACDIEGIQACLDDTGLLDDT